MALMIDSWYLEQAKQLTAKLASTNLANIEISEPVVISKGTSPCGWVQAWIRIDDPDQQPEVQCPPTSERSASESA